MAKRVSVVSGMSRSTSGISGISGLSGGLSDLGSQISHMTGVGGAPSRTAFRCTGWGLAAASGLLTLTRTPPAAEEHGQFAEETIVADLVRLKSTVEARASSKLCVVVSRAIPAPSAPEV